MALIELSDAALDTATQQARAAGMTTAAWIALAVHCHAHPIPDDAGMDDSGFPSPPPPAPAGEHTNKQTNPAARGV